MHVPEHFLRRPVSDTPHFGEFEELFAEQVSAGTGTLIQYDLAEPKWQFLCWMTEHRDVVLHGANNSTHDSLEPRRADDTSGFGGQQAVYAASDGLWPMYFAICDRTVVTSLVNGCIHLDEDDDRTSYYYFSIDHEAMASSPWRAGTIYVLSRATFEPEPESTWRGLRCAPTQWASRVPVQPIARLTVSPEDFPFLAQVRSHDQEVVCKRAEQHPDAFPWLEES